MEISREDQTSEHPSGTGSHPAHFVIVAIWNNTNNFLIDMNFFSTSSDLAPYAG